MTYEEMKTSFGKLSVTYNEVRPDYPEQLVNDVIKISGIKPDGRILEIGTGTGLATRPFAKRGYDITASDIGKELIVVAKEKLSKFTNINYIVASFEEIDLPQNSFNLIFAAQAFHWIDPKIRFKKASEFLKDNGYLGLFSNFQSTKTDLERQVRKLYAKHCPGFVGDDWYGTLKTMQTEFEESSYFVDVQRKTYVRDIEYTKEAYLGLISSFSFVKILPEDKKAGFFKEVEDLIGDKQSLIIPTESILLIGKKR